MVDAVSALDGHLTPRRVGTPEPAVTLSERRIGGLWQVSAWPGHLTPAGQAAADAVGAVEIPGPGRFAQGPKGVVLRTEPMRWLALVDAPLPRPAIAAEHGTALDLSHARTCIRVSGPATRDLLARHTTIDLRETAFGPGQTATAAMGSLAVTLMARTDGIELLVLRSFALALWEELLVSAEQFGAEVA